ncbi:hypothetical protein BHQ21_00465 [Mycobacterium sherrisii]|uniref:Mce protein n=1 Tax=Mycobacterium sherrisii TaxID=243061 RepID=A0A1E3T920_9MYCO|nr:hypothetical protein BHQ21_00465 [Mycobacterium sherrisii]
MAEAKKPPQNSATSKADTMALIAEAEAEAAEAEALAAAARARARAARLRREALADGAQGDPEEGSDEGSDMGSGVSPAAHPDESETDAPTAEVAATDEAATRDEAAERPEEPGDATKDAEKDTEKDSEKDTETVAAAPDETAEDTEPESETVRSGRRLRLPSWSVTWKAAAIILICAFIAASGYMIWQRHEVTERNQRAANFLAGAKQGVVNMTSLDFKRAKDDVQRVIDSSTGQFRDDFQQRAKDFITVVEQSKVVTEGSVTAAAVQSMDGNSAVVLVAATSRITNAAGAKNEPRRWRLKVTVTEDGGQYKMSKLEFIP